MEERTMDKRQIVEETMKIIGNIEIPVALNNIGVILNGCFNNLKIVLQMMEVEKKANQKPEENTEGEDEHVNAE